MRKRFLSVILICVMILSMTLMAKAAQVNSCGAALKWKFDSWYGILTISGTGKMYDYSVLDMAPWIMDSKTNRGGSINEVMVREGATSIGGCAFFSLSNLKSVVLPDTVTYIGIAAFSACKSLTHIRLPGSLQKIDMSAFSDCTGLASVVIPESVEMIGAGAFANCNSLETIVITNPNCAIDGEQTTLNAAGITTIYGYPKSTASAYAEKYGYAFKQIDDKLFNYSDVSDAINILVENRNLWLNGLGTSWGYTDDLSYGMIDFEGDGIPEMYVNSFGGTGLFSANRYFKIDQSNAEVYEIVNVDDTCASFDLTGKTIQVYQDENGAYRYLCSNSDRAGAMYGYACDSFMYMDGDSLVSVDLWGLESEYGVVSYFYYENGKKVFAEETQWNSYKEDFLKDYTKVDAGITEVEGAKIKYESDEELAATLAKMYASFYRDRVSGEKPGPVMKGLIYGVDSKTIGLTLYSQDGKTPIGYPVIQNGEYVVENIRAGEYLLVAAAEGYVTRLYPVSINSDCLTLDIMLHLQGDISGDGRVNVGDVAKIYAHSKRTTLLTDDYQLACADYNADRRINVGDAARVYALIKS